MRETITPAEAAARLGVTPNDLRQEMRRGTFPIGFAYCPAGVKWVYVIPRLAFERYMSGDLLDMEKIAQFVAEKVLARISA